ncbi:MAG: hypothetical protein WCO88_07395, partial [Actinomycetota bacterium]
MTPSTATSAPAAEPVQGERIAITFARVLRGLGLAVPIGAVLSFAEALAAVGVDQRDNVYWAGRATLVQRPEDIG